MSKSTDLAALRDRLGQEIAVSDWIEVTQQRIDRFAEATDDRQWIHVDPARAASESPFKTTIDDPVYPEQRTVVGQWYD